MRTFFLFYLLSSLLRNPLLALLVVAAIVYFSEARYRGRYFNPTRSYSRRQVINELRRTVSVNEHDVSAHNDLGRLLAEQGSFEQARSHLAKAIKRMEESPETNYYLGLCDLKTGQAAAGVKHIHKALELNPRFLYGRPQVVLARDAFEQGRLEEAVEEAQKAVRLNTSSVEGWVLLGQAEQQRGRPEAAREAFEAARQAFEQLPRYLRLPNRKWRAMAKRNLRQLRSTA